MHQENIWQTAAQCTGLTIMYDSRYCATGKVGSLVIKPVWARKPRNPGYYATSLDEQTEELLPQLALEACNGFLTTDPGYYVPRWVNDHLNEYKSAAGYDLQNYPPA